MSGTEVLTSLEIGGFTVAAVALSAFVELAKYSLTEAISFDVWSMRTSSAELSKSELVGMMIPADVMAKNKKR